MTQYAQSMTRPVRGLSLIWAMADNRVIGIDNRLPWRLPAELAYFRKVTIGHPVVMGRKTFESIGKPLPGRTNVVLTRDPDYCAEGVTVLRSVKQVLDQFGGRTLFVIGGAQIYRLFLPFAAKLFVTSIEQNFDGDQFFPEVDWSQWKLISEEPGLTDEKNPYVYRFKVFERKDSG